MTGSAAVTTKSLAHFATAHPAPATAVVSARGEIDAANAHRFGDYLRRRPVEVTSVVIDLTEVNFLGTEGFCALTEALAAHCTAGLDHVVVPSTAVRRLLRVCDAGAQVPTAASVTAALATLRGKNSLLQLVAKSR